MSTITNGNQKITPHLWFSNEAEEAAEFYASTFAEASAPSEVGQVSRYSEAAAEVSGIPAGTAMTVEFTLGERISNLSSKFL
jgi:predicted 3-demethylubiquinone-9 3-methyltransferase (glyoxalase superfamily)